MRDVDERYRFAPSLCLTHRCNLNCVYCYQKHDSKRMSLDTAKSVIDWIFANVPSSAEGVEIDFIGGEPLLEFDLIKDIYEYTTQKYSFQDYVFYATTNGTLLTDPMKKWLVAHKDTFVLGLSIDGLPETHNFNRSNSFWQIDIGFFLNTWPNQGVKMTLSDRSLDRLADNVIFVHNLGFKRIDGVNLFEGNFDWSKEDYVKALIPELRKLVDFYVQHDDLIANQMLAKRIDICEARNKSKRKWCGIGTGAIFFDTDGTKLPCAFVTPMTFSPEDLRCITQTDFSKEEDFVDDDCFNNCYIQPVCPVCLGANYLSTKSFKQRDKSKCRIQKLITLYTAELLARRLLKNPNSLMIEDAFNTITAIKTIKSLFLPEFKEYWDIM